MTILDVINDENLFRPFLRDGSGSISSWRNWLVALRCVYGLPVAPRHHELIRRCTGRDPAKLPPGGFRNALFLTGRRCGKSRAAALVAAFEACMSGREYTLAPGETGIVPVVSPTKSQSRIVRDYIRAIFDGSELLRREVVKDDRAGFDLANGVRIEILTADFRTTRGFTLIAAVVDELAFMGSDEESKVRSDEELLTAIRPALLTTRGRCICISSPYARRGAAFRLFHANFGNDRSRTLVWNCDSQTMNPTLDDRDIAEMVAEDPAAAESEVFGRFREDVAAFVGRDLAESLVIEGRTELLPGRHAYSAFCDISGGRSDDAALAVAHREGGKVVLDKLRRWQSPFSPQRVVEDIARELRRWGLRSVVGDNYSADFVIDAAKRAGLTYRRADRKKSDLYRELLPVLSSGGVELLDAPALVDQLSRLERRTRAGGREVIDHPPRGRDDLANVVAGVVVEVARPRSVFTATCLGGSADGDTEASVIMRREIIGRLAAQQAKERNPYYC